MAKGVVSKCHRVTSTATITYGYSYLKGDCTDVMVVGIVMFFLLAVILVEVMENAADERLRALLGSEGAIRLEDEPLPRYTALQPEVQHSASAASDCEHAEEKI